MLTTRSGFNPRAGRLRSCFEPSNAQSERPAVVGRVSGKGFLRSAGRGARQTHAAVCRARSMVAEGRMATEDETSILRQIGASAVHLFGDLSRSMR